MAALSWTLASFLLCMVYHVVTAEYDSNHPMYTHCDTNTDCNDRICAFPKISTCGEDNKCHCEPYYVGCDSAGLGDYALDPSMEGSDQPCSSFLRCRSLGNPPDSLRCPDGFLFDVRTNLCNHPSAMVCPALRYVDPCLASVCLGGGRCVPRDGLPHCECPPNYTGPRCETFEPCLTHVCNNNGTCAVNDQQEPYCECLPEFSGPECDERTCEDDDCCKDECNDGEAGFCKIPEFLCRCRPRRDIPCENNNDCHLECPNRLGMCNYDNQCDCFPGYISFFYNLITSNNDGSDSGESSMNNDSNSPADVANESQDDNKDHPLNNNKCDTDGDCASKECEYPKVPSCGDNMECRCY